MSNPDERPAPAGTTSIQRDGEGNELRPMTAGLMTRLFLVPALIVAVVITCAVLVTLGFGFIAQAQERPIAELIDRLAASSGDKVGPLLPPKEKEMWQAALELARRLEKPDQEVPAEQRPEVAQHLAATLTQTVGSPRPLTEATQKRIAFMALALGRLGEPVAVEHFARMLADDERAVRMAAIHGLAELGPTPANRARVSALFPILHNDAAAENRLAAATAIGQIAAPGNAEAIAALREQLVDTDEVRWNVALALARLGDTAGKPDVLDVLSREYWEGRRIRVDPSSDRTRPISEAEIRRNIRSALAALDRVRDREIRSAVEALTRDRDPRVAADAHQVLEKLNSMEAGEGAAGGAG